MVVMTMIAVGVGKWGISAMLLHHKWFMNEEKNWRWHVPRESK